MQTCLEMYVIYMSVSLALIRDTIVVVIQVHRGIEIEPLQGVKLCEAGLPTKQR